MANIFTKHPQEVGESYLQHLWGAWKYSFTLFLLVLTAFIHSIFPFVFKNTTSSRIIKMAEDLKTRK